jgi:hypothetical protein
MSVPRHGLDMVLHVRAIRYIYQCPACDFDLRERGADMGLTRCPMSAPGHDTRCPLIGGRIEGSDPNLYRGPAQPVVAPLTLRPPNPLSVLPTRLPVA